jgi:hypothetical protein
MARAWRVPEVHPNCNRQEPGVPSWVRMPIDQSFEVRRQEARPQGSGLRIASHRLNGAGTSNRRQLRAEQVAKDITRAVRAGRGRGRGPAATLSGRRSGLN